MSRRAAIVAISLLPRFTPRPRGRFDDWNPRGSHCAVEFRRLPMRVEQPIGKILKSGRFAADRIVRIDLSGPNVWHLQRRVRFSHAIFAVKNFGRVQRWRKNKLPVVVRWKRKLIVWDGHHRMLASRILGRRLRVRLITIRSARHG